jgi:hypothetical protein
MRGLGKPVEHTCASIKRMITSGNRGAQYDGVHKGCGGGCEMNMDIGASRVYNALEPNCLKMMVKGDVVVLLLERFG